MEENFSNKNFAEFGELPVICVFITHYSIQVVEVKSSVCGMFILDAIKVNHGFVVFTNAED